MCMRLREGASSKPLIAKRDIVVFCARKYRGVKDVTHTIVYDRTYKNGEKNSSCFIGPEVGEYYESSKSDAILKKARMINYGFHSFKRLKDALVCKSDYKEQTDTSLQCICVTKNIIPKGSKYHVGIIVKNSRNTDGLNGYVSDTIKQIGIYYTQKMKEIEDYVFNNGKIKGTIKWEMK